MPESAITIAYTELVEQRSERRSREGGFEATRVLTCAWDDRHTLAKQLLTNGSLLLGILRGPARYPDNWLATVGDVLINPLGKSTGIPADPNKPYGAWVTAKLTVHYTTELSFGGQIGGAGTGISHVIDDMEDENKNQELLTWTSLDFGSTQEFLTKPVQGLYWDAAGTAEPLPPEASPAVRYFRTSVTYTIHNITVWPVEARTYAGFVNDGTINWSRHTSMAAERVLFVGTEFHQVKTPQSTKIWDAVLHFIMQEPEWNKFYNPATYTFVPVYKGAAAGAYKPYPPVSFEKLWEHPTKYFKIA